MKTSTYAIIAFLLALLVGEAIFFFSLAATGKPRAVVDPDWQYTDVPATVEIDDTLCLPEGATLPQQRMEVTVDLPMVLVMPDGSECALPLDGSVYMADTLVIISRTHSLQVR